MDLYEKLVEIIARNCLSLFYSLLPKIPTLLLLFILTFITIHFFVFFVYVVWAKRS